MKFVVALVAVLFVAGQISAQGMPLPAECVKNIEDQMTLCRTACTLAKQWDAIGLYSTVTTGHILIAQQEIACKGKESEVETYFKLKYRPEEMACFERVRDGYFLIPGRDETSTLDNIKSNLDRVKTYFEKALNCAPVLAWTGSKAKI